MILHCCHILCCSFLYIFYTVTVLVYVYCIQTVSYHIDAEVAQKGI
jgi:hypothetical protein